MADVRELTYDEGRALLDKTARRLLGMSGEEFIAAWDSGEIAWDLPSTAINSVAILLPFARRVRAPTGGLTAVEPAQQDFAVVGQARQQG